MARGKLDTEKKTIYLYYYNRVRFQVTRLINAITDVRMFTIFSSYFVGTALSYKQ